MVNISRNDLNSILMKKERMLKSLLLWFKTPNNMPQIFEKIHQ
jgi:hypothetical protein